jgi:hypothetical protein
MQPKVYLSYSRKKPCALTALFYIENAIELYGWYVSAGSHCLSNGFFMIENFYSVATPVLYRSLADDVYGPWTIDLPPTQSQIRCPLPADIGHELESLQSRFIEEWLFFKNDLNAGAEVAAYRAHSLPVHMANIRFRKLHGYSSKCNDWVHVTAGADFNVAEFLEKNWRADASQVKDSQA